MKVSMHARTARTLGKNVDLMMTTPKNKTNDKHRTELNRIELNEKGTSQMGQGTARVAGK